MPRSEILGVVLLAYSQSRTDGAGLTRADWEFAEQEIETRYGGDFDALAKDLQMEAVACALACLAFEKETRTSRRAL